MLSSTCWRWQQRKHRRPVLLALCEGNRPVTCRSLQKGAVMWKVFPCRDVIMDTIGLVSRQSLLALQWRDNGRNGVSNNQPHDCLLNRLFQVHIKERSKLRVTGLCVVNSPVPGEFPAQMASKAENVSIWWRCYGDYLSCAWSSSQITIPRLVGHS